MNYNRFDPPWLAPNLLQCYIYPPHTHYNNSLIICILQYINTILGFSLKGSKPRIFVACRNFAPRAKSLP